MKYLSLAAIMITAMILNMVAALNFPYGSDQLEAWDGSCGVIILVCAIALAIIISIDVLKDLDD